MAGTGVLNVTASARPIRVPARATTSKAWRASAIQKVNSPTASSIQTMPRT